MKQAKVPTLFYIHPDTHNQVTARIWKNSPEDRKLEAEGYRRVSFLRWLLHCYKYRREADEIASQYFLAR